MPEDKRLRLETWRTEIEARKSSIKQLEDNSRKELETEAEALRKRTEPAESAETMESLMQKMADSLYERIKRDEAERIQKRNQENFKAEQKQLKLQAEAVAAKAEEEKLQHWIQQCVVVELQRYHLTPRAFPEEVNEVVFTKFPRDAVSKAVLQENNLTYLERGEYIFVDQYLDEEMRKNLWEQYLQIQQFHNRVPTVGSENSAPIFKDSDGARYKILFALQVDCPGISSEWDDEGSMYSEGAASSASLNSDDGPTLSPSVKNEPCTNQHDYKKSMFNVQMGCNDTTFRKYDLILHQPLNSETLEKITSACLEKTSTIISKLLVCEAALKEMDLSYTDLPMDFLVHEELRHEILQKLLSRTKIIGNHMKLLKDCFESIKLENFLEQKDIQYTEIDNKYYIIYSFLSSPEERRALKHALKNPGDRLNFISPEI
ncbi:hypothetical protein FPQ18DRAFT_380070, partial [Pyronema domesticum]